MDTSARRFAAPGLGALIALGLATAATAAPDASGWRTLTGPGARAPTSSSDYLRTGPDQRAAHVRHGTRAARDAAPDAAGPRPGSLGSNPSEEHAAAERRETLAVWGPWLTASGVSDNARQLVNFLEHADTHGLAGSDYGLAGLRDAVAARERAATRRALVASDPWIRAALEAGLDAEDRRAASNESAIADDRLERRLTHAFTRLATHLGRGVVDARSVQRGLYRDPPEPDIDALVAGLADGRLDVDAALAAVMPTHPAYRRLTARMALLLDERARGVRRTHVPEIGTNWVGHRHDDVMSLKRRLVETGELAPDTVLTPMFDAPLAVAVEAFRARHGLAASGVVDPRTREAMNVTLDDEIAGLALSLERWRWMPRDLGARHVFVNLPNYRVEVMDDDRRVVDMRAVIGSQQHETVVFSKDMAYIEFNPTWTVPVSIAHAELLPAERRNPGYLAKRNFVYLAWKDGRFVEVPHSRVTRETLARRPFPYTLRQLGGPNNALGRMKFMFPNPYAIYLHDTQAQKHFALDDRAYSHGCIRLSDPDLLAQVLLRLDGQPPDRARELLARGATARARLTDPVPVHMAYLTAWVDDDGALQRRRDVYRHDASLRIALEAAGTLLGRLAADPMEAATPEPTLAAAIAWRADAVPN